MKTKIYHRPIERVTNVNILNWLYKIVSDLTSRGYVVHRIKHDDVVATNSYRVTILYSGNIMQRLWRKITKW